MSKITCILFIYLFIPWLATGQSTENNILTSEQVIWYVKNYHPISKQADALLRAGESTILRAKGNFDPVGVANLDQKQFNDKNYFNILGAGLKVPTWYGIELKSGLDRTSGNFLNPENQTPNGGLWYAGISIPIGKGLVIDKRRATLKKARLYAQATAFERKLILNELYFETLKQYWNWAQAWHQLQIYEEAVRLAEVRFNNVKQSYMLGDKPAIDTLEAFIQVQNRQMHRNQNKMICQNAALQLSNFLWFENNTPLETSDGVQPPKLKELQDSNEFSPDSLNLILTTLAESHPEMMVYDNKLNRLTIDKKLRLEALKPELNLNYNILHKPIGNEFAAGLSAQNYKWGVRFYFPLFLRSERANLQLANIKLQNTELNRNQKLLELKNKVREYFNEYLNMSQQITLYAEAVRNYEGLLAGERKKFSSGESSLFLVNSRETNLIQAKLKLIELKSKFQTTQVGVRWAAGTLAK